MPDMAREKSDDNWPPDEVDIQKLADAFSAKTDVVVEMLGAARELYVQVTSQPRPANKVTIQGLRPTLERVLRALDDDRVHERLVVGAIGTADPDADEVERYQQWWEAKDRVGRAIAGAKELQALLLDAENVRRPSGRPAYENWEPPIRSLLDGWQHQLHQRITVSGHPDDGRKTKASETVKFVYEAMRLIDPTITQQACRSVIQSIRAGKSSWLREDAP